MNFYKKWKINIEEENIAEENIAENNMETLQKKL